MAHHLHINCAVQTKKRCRLAATATLPHMQIRLKKNCFCNMSLPLHCPSAALAFDWLLNLSPGYLTNQKQYVHGQWPDLFVVIAYKQRRWMERCWLIRLRPRPRSLQQKKNWHSWQSLNWMFPRYEWRSREPAKKKTNAIAAASKMQCNQYVYLLFAQNFNYVAPANEIQINIIKKIDFTVYALVCHIRWARLLVTR